MELYERQRDSHEVEVIKQVITVFRHTPGGPRSRCRAHVRESRLAEQVLFQELLALGLLGERKMTDVEKQADAIVHAVVAVELLHWHGKLSGTLERRGVFSLLSKV